MLGLYCKNALPKYDPNRCWNRFTSTLESEEITWCQNGNVIEDSFEDVHSKIEYLLTVKLAMWGKIFGLRVTTKYWLSICTYDSESKLQREKHLFSTWWWSRQRNTKMYCYPDIRIQISAIVHSACGMWFYCCSFDDMTYWMLLKIVWSKSFGFQKRLRKRPNQRLQWVSEPKNNAVVHKWVVENQRKFWFCHEELLLP
jgi:hypothetical protein